MKIAVLCTLENGIAEVEHLIQIFLMDYLNADRRL